ncbi:serine/threonine-protein kinase [Xylanibacter brevis]|uniref:OspG family effector kinase n=1 Tax=Xylanibacter brevis TaxID=83231 RepID=UPI000694D106|nr:serine/threonine-protein kinase [Xylanibacter brevis]
MPTIPSIRTSVENKNALILDEHAKNGTFKRDARGRLIAYAGGFSVVFPYEVSDGTKWAFRCWHSDINNTQSRYELISEAIQKAQLDFLCEFDYIEKGINVEGTIYPITRMRWIEGVTIKDYICQNKNSKELLLSLAEKFLKMTCALHEQSLAHGDLQHGNILVDKNHQLFLVDYDSFYCPQLKGEEDTVTGLPDYQHPARKSNKTVSEKLDYFSELIIYLSILSIAEAPSLVDKYKVEDAERLLFSKEDFDDITKSQIYKDIQSLGKQFQNLLDVLEEYLKCNSIDELLPFDIFLVEKSIQFSSSVTKAIRDKQTIVVNWLIPFEANATLSEKATGQKWNVDTKGHMSMTLSEDARFEIEVNKSDGKAFKKEIVVRVFDECAIEFKADKYYIYPSIPVVLSWKVDKGWNVKLDGEPIGEEGTKIVEPPKATSYVLSAEDEFGTKERHIDIQMLPVPQVKALFVPTPKIENNLSISIQQPRYNVDVKFPIIDIDWIHVEVPRVKYLTELGLSVELSPPLRKFSLMSSIKRVIKHIIMK